MITIAASIDNTTRAEADVIVRVEGAEHTVCVTFRRGDMVAPGKGGHRKRAEEYVKRVQGTRDLADTILVLAEAERELSPSARIGLQFLDTLACLHKANARKGRHDYVSGQQIWLNTGLTQRHKDSQRAVDRMVEVLGAEQASRLIAGPWTITVLEPQHVEVTAGGYKARMHIRDLRSEAGAP